MRHLLPALPVLAAPAAARDLPRPATKGWQHARTGLVLLPTLDGLQRTKLGDVTGTEHDVFAEFADPDSSTVATLYLFHPAVDDVAMWFERSEAALYNRATYGDVAPASADSIAFAPPGSMVTSALRRVYAPGKGPYRGTGLAMVPLGEWLVAIRMSSTADAPAALDRRLTRIIAALRWPANVAPAPPVAGISPCASPLVFDGKKAAESGKTSEPVRWCRDLASAANYGVYRDRAFDRGYTLAVQDAGRVGHIVPSLDAQMGKGTSYTMSFTDVDGTTTSFPGFDRLPAPDQVVRALTGPRVGQAHGTTVRIDAGALK